eukprot:3615364-Prorocentrum_lima.AAC.1
MPPLMSSSPRSSAPSLPFSGGPPGCAIASSSGNDATIGGSKLRVAASCLAGALVSPGVAHVAIRPHIHVRR